MNGTFNKLISTEIGQYYLVGTLAMGFSAWLVVNLGAAPAVFFGYSIILLMAMVYRFMTKSPFFEAIPLYNKGKLLQDIGVGLGMAALWYFLILPSPYGIIPLPPLPAALLAIESAAYFVVGVLAPVAEEYGFRGALLPQLEEITGNPIIAIVISALLFMSFHWMAYLHGALSSALIASFVFGLFTGAVSRWRKSIIPTVIIHAIINIAILSPAFAIIA